MNVIFDLDGTLADSAILTVTAVNRIAPEYGLPVPSGEDIRKTMGYANPEFYDRLFPDYPRELVRRAGEDIEREELRILAKMGPELLFAGCRELLEELRGRGHSLEIASTGSHEHVDTVLEITRIGGFFSGINCEQPDKAGMLRDIIGGGDRKGFIMVGDMRKDSDGARANGIPSVGACYGYCLREASNFDFYIDAPLELLNILPKIF